MPRHPLSDVQKWLETSAMGWRTRGAVLGPRGLAGLGSRGGFFLRAPSVSGEGVLFFFFFFFRPGRRGFVFAVFFRRPGRRGCGLCRAAASPDIPQRHSPALADPGLSAGVFSPRPT